jgi:4-amino-4-deoxychorismate lyase
MQKVKVVYSKTGQLSFEISPVPKLTLEALYPHTLNLPLGEKNAQTEPFKPSPLTGGALTMGPTDYKPVENHTTLKPTYTIYIDSERTDQSPHTSLKTTNRPHYDSSRARHVKSTTEEVLLLNPHGEITEGSMTTPYFWRKQRWTTPPVQIEYGGQRGTTRRWAIGNRLCVEEAVSVESLTNGEGVWISSGVQGFRWGKIVLAP